MRKTVTGVWLAVAAVSSVVLGKTVTVHPTVSVVNGVCSGRMGTVHVSVVEITIPAGKINIIRK